MTTNPNPSEKLERRFEGYNHHDDGYCKSLDFPEACPLDVSMADGVSLVRYHEEDCGYWLKVQRVGIAGDPR